MKTPQKLLFISTLLFIFKCEAQTITHSDSCCGNSISFTKINDSTYKVVQKYDDVILFEGGMVHPKLNELLAIDKDGHFQYGYLNRYHFDGKCILRNEGGEVTQEFNVKNNKFIYDKYYDNKVLYKEITYDENGASTKNYNNKGILMSERYESFDGKVKLNTYWDSKKRKTTYKTTQDGRHVPINYKYIGYDNEDRITNITEYDSITERPLNIKEFINGKPSSLIVFDEFSNYKTSMRFDANGDTTYWQEFLRAPNWEKDTVTIYQIELKPSYNLFYHYTYYKTNRAFKYTESDKEHIGIWKDNGYTIESRYRNTGKLVRTIRIQGEDAYLQEFNTKGQVIRKKIWHTKDCYIFSIEYNQLQLSNLSSFLMRLEKYVHQIYNPLFDTYERYKHIGEWLQDSIFNDNQLIKINSYLNDTFYCYSFTKGIKKLTFRSNYLPIFNDHVNCNQSLISFDGRWQSKEAFETIEKITMNDDEVYYYASKGGYACLFDWKGEKIFPLTYGLLMPYFKKGDLIYDHDYGYHGTDSILMLLVINNPEKKIHKVVDLYGNKLLESAYPIYPGIFRKDDNYYSKSAYTGFIIRHPDGKFGYKDLNGISLNDKYSSIEPTGKDKWILTTDSGTFIADHNGKRITNYFLKYRKLYYKDSILVTINNDSSFKVYDIRNFNEIKGYDNYKFLDEWNYIISDKSTGKKGKTNPSMNVIIPPKYDQIIFKESRYNYGKNKDSIDFYSSSGDLINKIEVDTIYKFIPPTNMFDVKRFEVSKPAYTELNEKFLVRKDSLFGIISYNGEWVIPMKYKALFITPNGQYATIINDRIELIRPLNMELENFNPTLKGRATMFKRADGYYTILVNDKGTVIAKDVDYYNMNYVYRTNSISIYRAGKYLGSINTRGRWLLKNDTFAKVNLYGYDYYYKTHSGKTGVMNQFGQTIVQPEYNYIAYDNLYKLQWYNLYPINRTPTLPNELANLWKVKSLTSKKVLDDTLHTPQGFYNGYLITQNNHGLYGVIDSNLNLILPFKYEQYYYCNIENNKLAFKTIGPYMEIYDLKFEKIQTITANDIYPLDGQYYLAYTNDKTYYLDSSFNVLDSSKSLFYKKDKYLYKPNNTDNLLREYRFEAYDELPSEYEIMSIEEESEFDDSTKIPVNIFNIITTVSGLTYKGPAIYFKDLPVFFQPEYDYNSYYYPHFKWDHLQLGSINFTMVLNLDSIPIKRFEQVELNTINYTYTPYDYYSNFISFRCSPTNNSEEKKSFTNLYIGDNLGLIAFNLNDLIDTKNKNKFNKLFFEELNKIQDEDIPCTPANDPYTDYNYVISISEKGLIIHVDENYSVTIPFNKLNGLLTAEWKDRLLNNE